MLKVQLTNAQGKPEVTNYASDSAWTIKSGSQLQFSENGSGKNHVIWGYGPFGERTKVWQVKTGDTDSTADGGWNRSITGLDVNKSYMNVVYVKRTTSATSGSFYHAITTMLLSGMQMQKEILYTIRITDHLE